MQNLKSIIGSLKTLEPYIRKNFKAEIRGVFGSYARGEQKKGSDIDILVHFLDGATFLDLVNLGDFLEGKLKRKVDIVSDRAVRNELKEGILQGVVEV